MTFDPNVPNASQSPGLFPPQNNTNFSRLKTIIDSDHVFNDSAQPTDGVHRQSTMIARAIPVGLPSGSNAMLYTWIDSFSRAQLRYFNGTTDIQITPGIVAMVNFNGSGAVGNQVIRSQINVSSVVKTATGRYTINFTDPMPNLNYIVQVCGHSMNGTNGISNGAIDGNNTYTSSVQTTLVRVQFNGSGSALIDVDGGFVVVTRVS